MEDIEFVARQWLEELDVVWMATFALRRGKASDPGLPGTIVGNWETQHNSYSFMMCEYGAQATGKMEFLGS